MNDKVYHQLFALDLFLSGLYADIHSVGSTESNSEKLDLVRTIESLVLNEEIIYVLSKSDTDIKTKSELMSFIQRMAIDSPFADTDTFFTKHTNVFRELIFEEQLAPYALTCFFIAIRKHKNFMQEIRNTLREAFLFYRENRDAFIKLVQSANISHISHEEKDMEPYLKPDDVEVIFFEGKGLVEAVLRVKKALSKKVPGSYEIVDVIVKAHGSEIYLGNISSAILQSERNSLSEKTLLNDLVTFIKVVLPSSAKVLLSSCDTGKIEEGSDVPVAQFLADLIKREIIAPQDSCSFLNSFHWVEGRLFVQYYLSDRAVVANSFHPRPQN